ncbi:MAG: hypothetical protein PHD02_00105 [Bacilli bacterium]|nr:hypothetical protein [Bacilli bacterium]
MNKKNITKLVIGIVLLLILFVVGYILLTPKGDNNTNQVTENDNERVVSKEFNFAIDSMRYLQIVSDIVLSEPLKTTEQMDINIKAYDKNNTLLHQYTASTKYYNIDDETEIHMAYDDNINTDLTNVDHLVTEISINNKTVESKYDYEFVVNNNPEVVYTVALYRVDMGLDDFFYDNSGIATVLYEDGEMLIERISYLDSINFIGVAYTNDFSTNTNGSALKTISVYPIGSTLEMN